jgi:hypothetical protein
LGEQRVLPARRIVCLPAEPMRTRSLLPCACRVSRLLRACCITEAISTLWL